MAIKLKAKETLNHQKKTSAPLTTPLTASQKKTSKPLNHHTLSPPIPFLCCQSKKTCVYGTHTAFFHTFAKNAYEHSAHTQTHPT